MHSLLRGTTLYASETYYNLIETEKRALESYDEDLVRKLAKTCLRCPTALLYLEFGFWPARFRIEEFKLNFLHQILNESESSLLFRFFEAQHRNPVKGDWVSEVKNLLLKLDFNFTFTQIKNFKKTEFGRLINKKMESRALVYL